LGETLDTSEMLLGCSLVGDAQGSKGMAEAIDHAQSILESVLREAKTAGADNIARSGIFGRELYLYVP